MFNFSASKSSHRFRTLLLTGTATAALAIATPLVQAEQVTTVTCSSGPQLYQPIWSNCGGGSAYQWQTYPYTASQTFSLRFLSGSTSAVQVQLVGFDQWTPSSPWSPWLHAGDTWGWTTGAGRIYDISVRHAQTNRNSTIRYRVSDGTLY